MLTALLLGCSPVKRLERLHKNHPYLFTAKTDTVIVNDTFRLVIPEVKIDTVVSYAELIDTLYIDKEHFHVKAVRIPGDSIYIEGRCDTIYKTVYREIKVPFTKYEVAPKNKSVGILLKVLILTALFLFLALVYRFFKKE